jgi:outer membrane receptor for ferrienterochelin and colicin
MNNKYRRLRSSFFKFLQGGLTAALAVLLLAIPVAGNAQETTSAIRGSIAASDGGPAAGASIRVTDTRTGRVSTATSSASGQFQVGDLSVGGPYTISITADNHAGHSVTDVFISLGETFSFAVDLSPATMDEIIVTAAIVQVAQVALGPATSFDFDDLQNMPAINRDINDVVRVDPRVYIDRAFVDSVQCVGANPRFNSLTVDGVKKNDNFGLNSNGYPTQRMPFPFDAIEQVSVELSPFDVQYGGFTACNINAVTRSGTNTFKGRVWGDYGDDGFQGDSLEGDSIDSGKFDDTRYGFSIGGPIVKDKFFFHLSYEKRDSADLFDRCAGDQSCGRPVEGVTQAQLDRIAQIAQSVYGYDPGETTLSRPYEDEKYLLRLDWTISDDHNAAFTYNYNDGFNTSQSDSDSDEYEFSNHFYERGAELNAYNLQVFSDWTDSFSTEFKVGYSELDNRQNTINNQGFGEVQIETYADVDGDGNFSQALVYLGGDDSRQSNDLDYDTLNLKLAANWSAGDHLFSFGYEMEEVDIFNLFLQHTIGEYRFDEQNTVDPDGVPGSGDEYTVGCSRSGNPDGCIDQFEALSPDDIYYGNAAPSLDPNDASALFKYAVNSFYVQDEITFPQSDFVLVAGLRYDWYTSSDLPRENSNFIARSGFTNSKNFDGLTLLQPRLGFSWGVSDDLTLRGGFGLYSGGNPNVWLGNNYQNDGFTQVQAREFNGGVADMNVNPDRFLGSDVAGSTPVPLGADGNGLPIFDAPQGIIDYVRGGSGNTGVNAIDPGFEIPANWKLSLGASWLFGDGYELSGDLIFSRSEKSAFIRDDTYVQIDTAPDGRPIYYQADKSVPGCATDPVGTGPACDRLFNGDYILDNVKGDDGEQMSFSTTLRKVHDFGLDWTLGYAFTDSTEVSPMTSSVAFSNYFNQSVADPNDPGAARANYEMRHRFIAKLGYQAEWFGDNTTRFTLFGSANQGRPYSATFSEQAMFICGPFFCADDDRSLLYMPDGPSDPNVVFDPGFDQDAFFSWAQKNDLTKYGGGIVKRNELSSDWWTKFDLRISQEIPGFGKNQKASIYFTIENLGNLINDDWGVLYERSFPRAAPVVEASLVNDQYVFEQFIPQGQSRSTRASLWKMRFGFQYNF